MMARIIIVANVLAILSSFIEQIGVSRSFPSRSICIQMAVLNDNYRLFCKSQLEYIPHIVHNLLNPTALLWKSLFVYLYKPPRERRCDIQIAFSIDNHCLFYKPHDSLDHHVC